MSKPSKRNLVSAVDISDEDIYAAMKDIPGYLDITSGDFKEIYRLAFGHALERITQSFKARDIMSKKVFSIRKEAPIKEVAELMALKGIAGVPVLETDGRVAGVISEKDFLFRMGAEGAKSFMTIVNECLKGKGCVAVSVRAQKAEDIMSSPAIVVKEETTAMQIADIFTEKNINRVPVVDEKGILLGIVSRADILKALKPGDASSFEAGHRPY